MFKQREAIIRLLKDNDPETAKFYRYKDVPIHIWERLVAAEFGDPSDQLFESEIKGQFGEEEITHQTFFAIPVQGQNPLAALMAQLEAELNDLDDLDS